MEIKKQLVKRSIAGDVILVPVGSASLELKGLLTLNETGERIWDLLPECTDRDEIVRRLMEEYDVDEATLRCDTNEFIDTLEKLDIL